MSDFPSPEEFCLNVPLYTPFSVGDENIDRVRSLFGYTGHLDAYCPACKAHTVSNCRSEMADVWFDADAWADRRLIRIVATCSRRKEHISVYYFMTDRETGVQKIGQYPSVAESNLFDAKKYSKILSKDDFRGLVKAIGLAAHGVGAGSIVYLRRIFESLISEAHSIASEDSGWDEVAYGKGRMQDRVKMLKSHLPSFLVEHHKVYSVLSNGVHELSEEDCLEFFPLLKMSIELILDQKILEAERAKKTQDVGRFLSKFNGS